MLDCPQCKKEVQRLSIPLGGKLGCVECNGERKVAINPNLGQTVDRYVRKDGTVGKITVGKDWEISQRRISKDDNHTVINQATGKLPQY